MSPVVKAAKPQQVLRRPRVLVVDDEPQLLEVISDIAAPALNCRLSTATTIAEARRALVVQSVDLLIVDIHLPDGDGTSLIELHRKHNPSAAAIIMTGDASMDRAITALRQGASDFLPKPFNQDELVERMRTALSTRGRLEKQAARIDRLREAVRKLNHARKVVSKKVDLLCQDLIKSYTDLNRQMESVRVAESFRSTINQAKDLEQLLCHAMDWLLRQIGYSNVAIWLATETGQMQLGAYMKYTVPGDDVIADALLKQIVPAALRDGFAAIDSAQLQEECGDALPAALADQEFVAINCTYLGESLATMVLFRGEESPFTDTDAGVLQAIAPIFGVALATMVKDTSPGDGENSEGDGSHADADWWKRGDAPPF